MIPRFADASGPFAGPFAGAATLPALLARRAELTPSATAYLVERPGGEWHALSWSQVHAQVNALATRLAPRGIGPGSRVGILSSTCIEWEIAQMAALARGAIVVGLDPYYPDALIDELAAELRLTDLFVQDVALLQRLADSTRRRLRFTALFRDDAGTAPADIPTLSRILADAGDDTAEPAAQPDSTALVAFSSGSTGRPQPIHYTHAQVVHACRSIVELYPELSDRTRLVCWLPLANLFQRMINFCATAKGASTYIVSDPRAVMDVLPVAKPDVFLAVPRFCERVHAGVMAKVNARPRIGRLVEAAVALAGDVRRAQEEQRSVPAIRRLRFALADRLVLSRLRAVFGGNLRFIVTGSAPMPRWLLDWFGAIGIPVLEAYGTSENLVPIAANTLTQRRAGTVGKPVGDNEVRIGDDGQVQVRGFGVFDPRLPDNAARALAVGDDGFLSTGDLGAFDDDGFLTLRGRRAEVFKNAQGRWVSLPMIEAALRRIPPVEHAAVVRLARDRLVGVLALTQGTEAGAALKDSEIARERVESALLDRLTHAVNAMPAAMRPIAFIVVCAGFSPASGELTTNLKLRRAAIEARVAAPLAQIASQDVSGDASTRGGISLVFA